MQHARFGKATRPHARTGSPRRCRRPTPRDMTASRSSRMTGLPLPSRTGPSPRPGCPRRQVTRRAAAPRASASSSTCARARLRPPARRRRAGRCRRAGPGVAVACSREIFPPERQGLDGSSSVRREALDRGLGRRLDVRRRLLNCTRSRGDYGLTCLQCKNCSSLFSKVRSWVELFVLGYVKWLIISSTLFF
jgi:hypothetical protein